VSAAPLPGERRAQPLRAVARAQMSRPERSNRPRMDSRAAQGVSREAGPAATDRSRAPAKQPERRPRCARKSSLPPCPARADLLRATTEPAAGHNPAASSILPKRHEADCARRMPPDPVSPAPFSCRCLAPWRATLPASPSRVPDRPRVPPGPGSVPHGFGPGPEEGRGRLPAAAWRREASSGGQRRKWDSTAPGRRDAAASARRATPALKAAAVLRPARASGRALTSTGAVLPAWHPASSEILCLRGDGRLRRRLPPALRADMIPTSARRSRGGEGTLSARWIPEAAGRGSSALNLPATMTRFRRA